MPRRKVVAKREILPDPKYDNQTVAKFINHVMTNGKKSVAERIVYGALTHVETRTKRDPVDTFEKALEAVAPVLEVKSRRVGGATYQVPVEVRPTRREALAMRWLVDSARGRSEKTMASAAGRRVGGRRRRPRRRRGAQTRGHASHGGRQPGVLALPVLAPFAPRYGQLEKAGQAMRPPL